MAWRPGYGWSLPPLYGASRPGQQQAYASQIRVFSAKGLSAPGTLGTAPLPQIGVPIAGTNLVYVRPRLSQDPLGGFDGSIFPYVPFTWPGQPLSFARPRYAQPARIIYTNHEYSFYRENRRTPSIGMAAAGQQGLTMDVPWQSQADWFGLPA